MAGPVWYQDDGRYSVAVYEYADHRPGRASGFTIRLRWHAAGAPAPARARAGTDRDAAIANAAEHWGRYLAGEVTLPELPPETVAELIERFCRRTHARDGHVLSDHTCRNYKKQLAHLKAVCQDGKLPVRRLATAHVERAIVRMTSAASNASLLRSVRALARWAIERHWLELDPTRGLRVVVPHEIRPWLRADDIPAFLASCRPAHRIRAALAIETGLRVGELLALRWDWVLIPSVGRSVLRVPAFDDVSGFRAKSRRARSVPLSQVALAALEAARARWGAEGYVLHDREPGQKLLAPEGWWRQTVEACDRAGLSRVDMHGLRRTAGARWLLTGVPIHVVSRWLGHASVLTTERSYAGLDEAGHMAAMDLVDAAAAVPRLPARDRAREGHHNL